MNRMTPQRLSREIAKGIQKDSTRANEVRDAAFRRVVLSIPKGKFLPMARSPLPQATPCITGQSRVYCGPSRPIVYPGNA